MSRDWETSSMKRAALGIRIHSGWGVLVAVSGDANLVGSCLVPDETNVVFTSGFGTATDNGAGNIQTDNFATTARTLDGSLVLFYCPPTFG
jgi:hypothetical protein